MKRFCFYVDENDEIAAFLLSIPSKALRGEVMRGIIREWMENVKDGKIKSHYAKYLNSTQTNPVNRNDIVKKRSINHDTQNISRNINNNADVKNQIEAVFENFGIDDLE